MSKSGSVVQNSTLFDFTENVNWGVCKAEYLLVKKFADLNIKF